MSFILEVWRGFVCNVILSAEALGDAIAHIILTCANGSKYRQAESIPG